MIIVRPTLTPISPLGMEASSGTVISSGNTDKIVNMVPKAGTSSSNIVNNDLVVNGAGNITVSASCTAASTLSFTLRIYLNGVEVSVGGNSSASWTGNVIAGDLISIWGRNGAFSGTKTIFPAEVSYAVNSS